jgi:hypothetical protein
VQHRANTILILCDTDRDESYITINILPDDVLLEIFDFWVSDVELRWRLLGHVCRRWREIVFASPRRLNLQILCTHRTPVKTDLGIWPTFPITIVYDIPQRSRGDDRSRGEDNIIAALEHKDRVYKVRLRVWYSQLAKITAVMREPFPLLTHLDIVATPATRSDGVEFVPVLPIDFLGGSAPRLHYLSLLSVPFPTIRTILLSTNNLVSLCLYRIPQTGYISPEAMLACLAVLSKLERFDLGFLSVPDQTRRPPITEIQTVLPALTNFTFLGTSEYLEDLVARINSPKLDQIRIDFVNQPANFQASQLSQFIGRTGPVFSHAEATFSDEYTFSMHPQTIRPPWYLSTPGIIIRWGKVDWRVSHVVQAISQFKMSATLSNVVHLKLELDHGRARQLEGSTYDVEWQRFLRQFSNVKTLYVSRKLAPHISLVLEEIAEGMAAEVLPSLDLIWLGGQRASSIKKFVASRRLADRRVTVIGIKKEFNRRIEAYDGI